MSQTVQINLTTGTETENTIIDLIKKSSTAPRVEVEALINFFQALGSGQKQGYFDLQVNNGTARAASGTIAFSGVSTANDTILINGVTLTAVASGATPTNNQWNAKLTAAAQATEVARAINASTTSLVSGQVTASVVSSTTVKIQSNFVSIAGNAVTIAEGVDGGSVMTVSGARLTAGAAITANVYHYGQ